MFYWGELWTILQLLNLYLDSPQCKSSVVGKHSGHDFFLLAPVLICNILNFMCCHIFTATISTANPTIWILARVIGCLKTHHNLENRSVLKFYNYILKTKVKTVCKEDQCYSLWQIHLLGFPLGSRSSLCHKNERQVYYQLAAAAAAAATWWLRCPTQTWAFAETAAWEIFQILSAPPSITAQTSLTGKPKYYVGNHQLLWHFYRYLYECTNTFSELHCSFNLFKFKLFN